MIFINCLVVIMVCRLLLQFVVINCYYCFILLDQLILVNFLNKLIFICCLVVDDSLICVNSICCLVDWFIFINYNCIGQQAGI